MKLALALMAAALPLQAHAQSKAFNGAWYDSCDHQEYGAAVEISGSDFNYYTEVYCRLGNPTSIRDMSNATLFDAECSGEESHWNERMFIGESDGTLFVFRYSGETFHRCD